VLTSMTPWPDRVHDRAAVGRAVRKVAAIALLAHKQDLAVGVEGALLAVENRLGQRPDTFFRPAVG
jgi:hypothetical protein